ncbi:MAG: undecaprenyl-diphosphatase UppP [Anaerolineales bacterium]
MTIIQAIILGVIQGLSEFIPISSSAHLVITQSILGWNIPDQQAFIFDVLVHLGTLIAVVIYFRKDLWDILRAVFLGIASKRPFSEYASRLGWIIIFATIPSVIVGFIFQSQVAQAFSSPLFAGIFLSVTAILLLLAEIIGRRSRKLEEINWKDGLIIGLFQAIALLPGISRSGSAITGGMLRNLDRPSSARFSFLLSIPAIVGAVTLASVDLIQSPNFTLQIPTLVAGFIASGLVGYLSIRWLLSYLTKRPLYIFSVYCLVVSIIIIIFWIIK